MSDVFNLAGKTFNSRLIIGTGKYRSFAEMQAAHTASGAEMVTVAVNRVPLDRATESFLDHLSPDMQILPNTAGCYDAEHAIRTARLGREARIDTCALRFFRDFVQRIVIGLDQLVEAAPARIFRRNLSPLDPAAIGVHEKIILWFRRRIPIACVEGWRAFLGLRFCCFI